MSKQFISFTDINQFRRVVKDAKFHGIEKATFHGTVKLHGTNAAVCYDGNEMWVQSRNNIITPENDNAGCAQFVEETKDYWMNIFCLPYHTFDTDETAILYFEWCGGSIQKGVAINELPKMAVIFAAKTVTSEGSTYGKMRLEGDAALNIYSINDFPTFEIEVDFNYPERAQDEMIKMVESVEAECPVAKQLGVSGVGEGIVWYAKLNERSYWFKTKGEKHSSTKVKKLAEVDIEKINSIREFVEYAVTENRLNQALENIGDSIKDTGKFLSWIVKDIHKEEADTLAANGLEQKEVNKYISTKARAWFMKVAS